MDVVDTCQYNAIQCNSTTDCSLNDDPLMEEGFITGLLYWAALVGARSTDKLYTECS